MHIPTILRQKCKSKLQLQVVVIVCLFVRFLFVVAKVPTLMLTNKIEYKKDITKQQQNRNQTKPRSERLPVVTVSKQNLETKQGRKQQERCQRLVRADPIMGLTILCGLTRRGLTRSSLLD
jgi:hypothetical protein